MSSKSAANTAPCYIAGVGMTKFQKPRGKVDYPEIAYEAGIKAMLDAGINYDDVDQGVACFVYGDTCAGERVFYQFGMTQIPIYNVNNACATGSTGLHMAKTMISHGVADCILVVGFEKMWPGSTKFMYDDRDLPSGPTIRLMASQKKPSKVGFACESFARAGAEYMERYGAEEKHFAEIGRVNHEHSQHNPYAQFQSTYTLDEVQNSGMILSPITKLQCCPTSDGAAAAVLVSQKFLDSRLDLKKNAIEIAGQCLATDAPSAYNGSFIDLIGYDMTKRATLVALEQAKVTIKDVGVIELHDCFSANEMVVIDALGLCEPGTAHKMIEKGDITYGGKVVINPSGGLISKGHPLGATGLAQCAELVWQLRGWAGKRSVKDTKVALQHNLGLGGAVVVTVYKRADGEAVPSRHEKEIFDESHVGYNPGVEARGFTPEQADRVRSRSMRSDWPLQSRFVQQNKM